METEFHVHIDYSKEIHGKYEGLATNLLAIPSLVSEFRSFENESNYIVADEETQCRNRFFLYNLEVILNQFLMQSRAKCRLNVQKSDPILLHTFHIIDFQSHRSKRFEYLTFVISFSSEKRKLQMHGSK